jgi:hypothetical protein
LPPQEFGLVVGEPVHFRFFGSSVRRQDQVGTLLDYWSPDELQELEEIQATLPPEGRTPGEVVPVKLHARVTEAGTLELEAIPRGTKRALESRVRRARQRERLSVMKQYIVGIDLGTSNTVVAYVEAGHRRDQRLRYRSARQSRRGRCAAVVAVGALSPGAGRAEHLAICNYRGAGLASTSRSRR